MIDGKKIGFIATLHPTVLENIDKKCAIAVFEIATKPFSEIEVVNTKYSEPSRFPAIDIDITFAADIGAIAFDELVKVAKSSAGELLSDVKMKDVYTADGASAITLRFTFVSKERTLTKQELIPLADEVVKALSMLGLVVKA